MPEIRKYVTLCELQSQIREKIGVSFPLPYWVVAEISEIKVNHSGHCYLELVEKGGDNQVPRAKVNAVIWKGQYGMISSYFRTATGSDLCSGLKVLLKVMINYHELYGMSFQITDIEPSFTLGDIEAQKRETIEKLKTEGVFDMNRELELPCVLQRIAVISSSQAAGYQDFLNELGANANGYYFRLELFNAFMQGNETEPSVIDALDRIAERYDEFDAVIMIRGGGSQSDLAAFNSYRLVSHVAQFPLPVITGIGHDKDTSVADLVANVSVKTPTAVAVYLNSHNREYEDTLNEMFAGISLIASERIAEENARIKESGFLLKEASSGILNTAGSRLNSLSLMVENRVGVAVASNRGKLDMFAAQLTSMPLRTVGYSSKRLAELESLLKLNVGTFISGKKKELAFTEDIVEAKTPERIMKLGYSIVRLKGRVVRSTVDVSDNDLLEVRLSDGSVKARVENKK